MYARSVSKDKCVKRRSLLRGVEDDPIAVMVMLA